MKKADVIIVGGGPAGSSCARILAQNGLNCLILDRESFPRKKTCAGWITPEVLQLLDISAADYPYGLTKFNMFRITVRGLTFGVRVHQFAIRRIEFDNWLLHRSGARFEQHNVTSIKPAGGGYIIDDTYTCQYLVGAGGTTCPVYRNFFREKTPRMKRHQIAAMEEEFAHPSTGKECHLWFMEDGLPGYGWYVPKAGGFVNVGIGGKIAKLKARGRSLKEHWNRFVENLDQSGLVRGHTYHPEGLSYYLRGKNPLVRNGNALIVGDAVGLATMDMGEGIRGAVQSGIKAAKAILADRSYDISSIPKYSFPSMLRSRWG